MELLIWILLALFALYLISRLVWRHLNRGLWNDE